MLQLSKQLASYFITYLLFGFATALSCLAFGFMTFKNDTSTPFYLINFYSGVFGITFSFCLNFFWNFKSHKKKFLTNFLRFVFVSMLLLILIIPLTQVFHYFFEDLLSVAFSKELVRLLLHALVLFVYFMVGFFTHYLYSFNVK